MAHFIGASSIMQRSDTVALHLTPQMFIVYIQIPISMLSSSLIIFSYHNCFYSDAYCWCIVGDDSGNIFMTEANRLVKVNTGKYINNYNIFSGKDF